MHCLQGFVLLSAGFAAAVPPTAVPDPNHMRHNAFDIHPFTVNLTDQVPHMLDLVNATELPKPIRQFNGVNNSQGISLGAVQDFRQEWLTTFDWDKEQAQMNTYPQYTTTIEDLTIHFIHMTCNAPNAIPLILLHGWPSSFLEMIPLLDNLTRPSNTRNDTPVIFDVVVPSLPGFGFSSAPSPGWNNDATARIFNNLMTSVLGYNRYAVFGTDWGAGVAWAMYSGYNESVRALESTLIPYQPFTLAELEAANLSLDSTDRKRALATEAWFVSGNSYFNEQQYHPNTIGLALYDNPVGQLAWIGELFLNWTDPRSNMSPSVLSHNEILRTVSLYYLTKTFISSIYEYAQNPDAFKSVYAKVPTDAPFLFTDFHYNIWFWPEDLVAKVGNLVYFKYHDFGGHFPALENPPALIEDLREIGAHWEY